MMIEQNIDDIVERYKSSDTNHVVIADLFDKEFIKKCEEEFLNIDESKFFRYSDPYFEYEKYSMNDMNNIPENLSKLFSYIHSLEFVKFVEKVTGIKGLIVDEKRWGGGLHMTKPGGYLSIHKDFNVLPDSYVNNRQMLRCVNLIGYLTNEDQTENNGHLEFWKDGESQKVCNSFNNWVIFDTRDCYHGHPNPFSGEKPRMSIASYYYIEQEIDLEEWSSTEYLKLPWMEDSEEYSAKRIERSNPKIRYQNIYNQIESKNRIK
jgi:hypothetical protein